MKDVPPTGVGLLDAAPILITSDEELVDALALLADQAAIGVDTESNSLHAYRERVCLIQLAAPGHDILIDPLSGVDIALLADIFASDRIQKVFHAAEYDVMCLKRDFGFSISNLFDTMWAARILGWERVGLASILAEVFDVRVNKRYQRYDWGQRPLADEAITYAALDAHYLLSLRELEREALIQAGRWREAEIAFAEIAVTPPKRLGRNRLWRIKGARRLNCRQQSVLAELCAWREQQACLQDCPPFKVLGDRSLVTLAQVMPATRRALARADGLRPHHLRRYGDALLQAIERGRAAPPPRRPESRPSRAPDVVERFRALRSWRKMAAQRRGVRSDVILSTDILWRVAERAPHTHQELLQVDGLNAWRCEQYGEQLLEVVRSMETGE
jgi:ribonuclease D